MANIVTGETRWVDEKMVADAAARETRYAAAAGHAPQTGNQHFSHDGLNAAGAQPQPAATGIPQRRKESVPYQPLPAKAPPLPTRLTPGTESANREGPSLPASSKYMGGLQSKPTGSGTESGAVPLAPKVEAQSAVRKSKVDQAVEQKRAALVLQRVLLGYEVRKTRLYPRLRLLHRRAKEVELLDCPVDSEAKPTDNGLSPGSGLAKSLAQVELALSNALEKKDLELLQLLRKSLVGIGETLTQAMIAVDGVQSDGDERIRQARKEAIKRIQAVESKEIELKERVGNAIKELA